MDAADGTDAVDPAALQFPSGGDDRELRTNPPAGRSRIHVERPRVPAPA
jgi:hypothetical protein